MRYFYAVVIALVFLYNHVGADTCTVKPGFVTSYASRFTKKYLGPMRKDGQLTNKNRNCACLEKYGADLQENEDDVTNPDNLVRPCSVGDYECMRSFLANNSKCTPSRSPVPDPLLLEQLTLIIPIANLTLTGTNVTVKGLNKSEVTDFYFNKVTGNVVIIIETPTLNETSPKVYYSYLRKKKETLVLADAGWANFKNVIFTAIIPKMPNLCMGEADIHVDGPAAENYIGPKAYTSDDPEVKASFQVFYSTNYVAQKESFVHQAQLFAGLYIQNYLCDFNATLSSA